MTQGLAKYHSRAPRYILSADDDSLVRVAGPQQIPWEEHTEIKNVSLTGMAFTAPFDLCPVLGEIIKVQFSPPPHTKQMASYALVTRIDRINSDTNLVAVHFYKMDMAHRISLAQGLSQKIKENIQNPHASDQNRFLFDFQKFPKLFTFISLMALWLYSIDSYLILHRFSAHFMERFFYFCSHLISSF